MALACGRSHSFNKITVLVLRRIIQLISLGLFLLALGLVGFGTLNFAVEELFLQMDPVVAAGTALSGRALGLIFLPGAIILLSAPFLGRSFCGYVCPMGTTLDGGDKLIRPSGKFSGKSLSHFKYIILLAILGSALVGVSFVFLASPLSLITRFYGLIILPVAAWLVDGLLSLSQPLVESLGWTDLALAQVRQPIFATQFFVLTFFGLLFWAAKLSPRFWCRFLCPSGALLGLFSGKPAVRRRVTEDCTECGLCRKRCPMGAIPEDPAGTDHRACFLCRTCQEVCPAEAVRFSGEPESRPEPLPVGRRGFIGASLSGLGLGVVSLTSLAYPGVKTGPGRVGPEGLIRPPGTLPEADFLARCIRCGECLAACPTNTLQPIWFKAGLVGLFSPATNPRRAGCDPRCNRCAQVCPTDAIRTLIPEERLWAKTGTAVVLRERCLAWEHQKKCLVCDEVCPFDAIKFMREEGNPIEVPHVIEDKCAGCGYCEHLCPIKNKAAIVVTAQGQVRLREGSYIEEGRARNLSLALTDKSRFEPYGSPPEESASESGLPPGFSE